MKKLVKLINQKPNDEKVNFNAKTLYDGHLKVTYRGVKAIRCPFDYVIYQMIISEVKPDLIIEIGANQGGGALYLADLMTLNNTIGEVHSIDVGDYIDEKIKNDPRIKFFFTGWENYNLELTKKFNKILIIEDAEHSYECTIGVLKKFAEIVSFGSYIIVEDGIVNKLKMDHYFNGGPLKAINEFLPQHEEFVIDRKWCDFFGKNATFNVNGYLKRIK
ncbi:MAG: hypothetical protein IPM51_01150 [Sphingobacteriaceae bacterium]|nr:hypothetical protein [Sphingobacteriaceae bacterium]